MSEQQTPCIPALMKQARGGKSVGDPCGRRGSMNQAREELTKRVGPPQGDKNVCCHDCHNDSTAPNGFVCTLHTRWGTQKENVMDQDPEARRQKAAAAGRASVLAGGPAAGGKVGGRTSRRIVNARPDNANKLQVTCPHCGKAGQKLAMSRYHFERCKHKP